MVIFKDGKNYYIENELLGTTLRMLNYFEGILTKGNEIIINNGQIVGKFVIPGDISSAAFLMVAATLVENSI